MSVAACGGGMGGSDDDNGGGEKKRKRIPESFHSPPLSTDEDTDDEKEADDQSKGKRRRSSLDSVASLEASLPMKRGLSSNYDGRSKSFGNLSELGIEDTKELGKKEHPVNKRRRLKIAHEIREKSLHDGASSNMAHTSSMPAFLSDQRKNKEEDEESDNEDNKEGDDDKNDEDDRE